MAQQQGRASQAPPKRQSPLVQQDMQAMMQAGRFSHSPSHPGW
jgi:hypothetical protein